MRRIGQIINPRDDNGWMIPREGTKRRQVYDLMIAGKAAGEIMQQAKLSRAAYGSHRHFIACWEKANRSAYAVKHR